MAPQPMAPQPMAPQPMAPQPMAPQTMAPQPPPPSPSAPPPPQPQAPPPTVQGMPPMPAMHTSPIPNQTPAPSPMYVNSGMPQQAPAVDHSGLHFASSSPSYSVGTMQAPDMHQHSTSTMTPASMSRTTQADHAMDNAVKHETVVRVLSLGAKLLEEKHRDLLYNLPPSRRSAIASRVDAESRSWPISEREERQRAAVKAAIAASQRGIGSHAEAFDIDPSTIPDDPSIRVGGGYLYSPGGGLLSKADFWEPSKEIAPPISYGVEATTTSFPHLLTAPPPPDDRLLLTSSFASPTSTSPDAKYAAQHLLEAEIELNAVQETYRALLAKRSRAAGQERVRRKPAVGGRGKGRGGDLSSALHAELAECKRRMHIVASRVGMLRSTLHTHSSSPTPISSPP